MPSHSHQVTNTRDAKCPVAGAAPHLQTMSHHHPLTSSFQNSTNPSEHTLQGSSMPMQPQATLSAPPPWGHKFTKIFYEGVGGTAQQQMPACASAAARGVQSSAGAHCPGLAMQETSEMNSTLQGRIVISLYKG